MEAGIQQLIIGLGAIQILPLYSERQGGNQKTESADNLRECDSDQRVKKNFWNFSGRHIQGARIRLVRGCAIVRNTYRESTERGIDLGSFGETN